MPEPIHQRAQAPAQRSGSGPAKPVRQSVRVTQILGRHPKSAKPTVARGHNRYEQEADRVADRVMQLPKPKGSDLSHRLGPDDRGTPRQQRGPGVEPGAEQGHDAGLLGQSPRVARILRAATPGSGRGLSCTQRSGETTELAPGLSGRIRQRLGAGEPLADDQRAFFEPRFGRGFAGVRVHRDPPASQLAASIGARAFTLGNAVFFRRGEYQPGSPRGRRLLGHELTHVVQQGGATEGRQPGIPVSSRADRVVAPERDIGDSYSDAELQAYLSFLNTGGAIEDHLDSDNKARTIVAAWRHGGSPYTLSPILKVLLIREMQSGFTGDDDEWAILELLWRSDNSALTTIFTTIQASDLNSDFHGSEWDELQVFYSRRFSGGMTDLLAGTVAPTGAPLPLGADLSLMEGLAAPSAVDQARVMAAINTEVRTSSGAPPTFSQTITGEADPWEVRVRDAINAAITSMYTRMVASRPARIPANMFADTHIDRVAADAQSETDSVYGSYYGSRPAFAVGTNIRDAFTTRDAGISASTANADWAANFRVLKLLNGNRDIADINRQHGAIHTRSTEWGLIAPILGFPLVPVLTEAENDSAAPHVTTGIVGTRRAELLDIHRNWPAFAGGGTIFLDRMKAATDAENRDKMYDLFGTVIHEYIHTLEHADHVAFRRTLRARQGGFVLREGMTEYLAKRVWDRVDFNSARRTLIEGVFQDPLNPDGHSIALPPRYDEWRNAGRAAMIVGLDNALAAFFLGRVDLIGGP